MHIVVTGGSGFIGRALCRTLQADGHTLTVLSRSPARHAQDLRPATVTQSLESVTAVDAIVNLAGASLFDGRWTAARKQEIRNSRLQTTEHLVRWVAAQSASERPRCIVSGSAVGYYGDCGAQKVDESFPSGTDFAAQLCKDWEIQAMRLADLGLRVSTARTGIVLGEGGALPRLQHLFSFGLGSTFGDGAYWMSWIHIADQVRLLQWLLTHGQSGPYNATAPFPVTNAEFSHLLARAMRRPCWFSIPKCAITLGLGEASSVLMSSARVIPQRAQTEGFAFDYPDLEAALRQLIPQKL